MDTTNGSFRYYRYGFLYVHYVFCWYIFESNGSSMAGENTNSDSEATAENADSQGSDFPENGVDGEGFDDLTI